MKREDIKSIIEGITDEQLSQIMDLNGKDVEKEKGKLINANTELDRAKQTIESMTNELQSLKDSNATAEDWKSKFETLQADIAAKEENAKLQAENAEREQSILNRYNAAVGEREFTHEAIRADYLKKFTEAIADTANIGKSDADIFHSLTKDDASAFKGIQPQVTLKGASPIFGGNDDMQIRSIMGLK